MFGIEISESEVNLCNTNEIRFQHMSSISRSIIDFQAFLKRTRTRLIRTKTYAVKVTLAFLNWILLSYALQVLLKLAEGKGGIIQDYR